MLPDYVQEIRTGSSIKPLLEWIGSAISQQKTAIVGREQRYGFTESAEATVMKVFFTVLMISYLATNNIKYFKQQRFLELKLLAHLHEDEIGNKTSNGNRWRDVRPHRCSKRQSFDVLSGSNTA